MTNYNKLVRDRIPEMIKEAGKTPVTKVIPEEEMESYLIQKLEEEIREFKETRDFEELADLLEVIDALAKLRGDDLFSLERIKADKKTERGGFEERILLESVED
ncbi:nucleoside triphosphate pyrophosphohydrolase [Isachenkonia alkalipeptolytica]|uniref:Phosphoribosyl-ATP pyrophosphohydrolase n=1 Tax=Isachenkonia alkalipeptolytica TaxID=2565777 RepID=A0AA43XL78_9CLOT|nr:nucleoside triphosphate pyrophosphohydrolase [Isachenkonia alkalipeptolytica]NBG88687.1 phosphoribosyl-ATP pyrophosphohydrolase [Isachenkonia alkalipeptolytica]